MTLLFVSIAVGTIALLAALGAGLLESRIGSIVTAALTLLIVIGALPTAAFLVTSATGLLISGYMVVGMGEFYHRLFRSGVNRRQSASNGEFRCFAGIRTNRFVFAVAW